MTEETESRIPYTDLARVAFECKQCQAEISVDITKQEHVRVENTDRPMVCPICGNEFDSQLKKSFSHLYSWRHILKESGHKVYFRIERG